MKPLLTAAQMRAADEYTIETIGIPGAVLMETAGRALAAAATDYAAKGARVAVLCGSGNNGGDGFVAARVLREWGYESEVFLVLPAPARGDAQRFYATLEPCGVPVVRATTQAELEEATAAIESADIIVDAVFGTGLCREVAGHVAELFARVNALPAPVIAADIASGLCSDRGATLGVSLAATCTVSMGAAKLGQVVDPGFARSGELRVAEIGIPSAKLEELAEAFLTTGTDVQGWLPSPAAKAHKATRGHVLAVAGSDGKHGAGRMAAMAALRTGAGLVTLAAASLDRGAPDPVMTAAVSEPGELASAWEGKAALLIGPGMASDPAGAALVDAVARDCPVPAVLDADALRHLAVRMEAGERLPTGSAARVLTPHPGEASGLLGKATAEIQRDRLAAARELAAKTRAVVVLKGARTCIADGRSGSQVGYLCRQGGPDLATAGTGDVLAGMIAGLLAQGRDALDAARCAVYWHGVAGRIARHQIGGVGVVASDVVAAIPAAHSEIASAH